MMMTRRLTSALAGLLLLAGGAAACIEALDLNQMVAKTDMAVRGTITSTRTVKYVPEDGERLIYTLVTVEGEDLYSGESTTLEAGFLGGTYQGDTMTVTCMPQPAEYRIGNDVVVFSAPVEGWGPEIERCVYAAMGGIFREVKGGADPVVLGKGEGFAIEKNVRVSQLRRDVARALRAKEVK